MHEVIEFKDVENVKAICIENWDTDKDGEISYAEAAAVESLGNVFRENSTITSFDELQYFTGLTKIPDNAFYACTSLASVTLPSSVTTIGGAAFAFCESLTSVTIPEGVTEIGVSAFEKCTGLTSITIPANVTSIGDWAFLGCTSLTSVTCLAATPPSLEGAVFWDSTNLSAIYVPKGKVDSYKEEWSDYEDLIKEISE